MSQQGPPLSELLISIFAAPYTVLNDPAKIEKLIRNVASLLQLTILEIGTQQTGQLLTSFAITSEVYISVCTYPQLNKAYFNILATASKLMSVDFLVNFIVEGLEGDKFLFEVVRRD